MPHILVFLFGAFVAAAGLFIGYFAVVAALGKKARELGKRQQQLDEDQRSLAQKEADVNRAVAEYNEAIASFNARKVQFEDLVTENGRLKQDLFNLHVRQKKLCLDQAAIEQRQGEVEQRATDLARRYLGENVALLGDKLTPNNFATSRNRLLKVIESVRGIGFRVTEDEESEKLQELKARFEQVVRLDFQRQEQTRIKAQIRDEERLAREIQKKIDEAKREEAIIEEALKRALKESRDEHSAEVERLRAQLKEAQEKSQRAVSQAQLTKSGYVYVLSNIGAFGENVYKIGMTRRLEPMDRVRELGDASVPFPFDVHMMVSCDNAPALENALHRQFHRDRVNKVNLRKEYFRADIESIAETVKKMQGEIDYLADPEALEYRETLSMTAEDEAYLETVVGAIVGDEDEYIGEEQ
jgi:hypothetical protein